MSNKSLLPELTEEQIEKAVNSPEFQELKEKLEKQRQEELRKPNTMKLFNCCPCCTCGDKNGK
jgi:hypothetical protein